MLPNDITLRDTDSTGSEFALVSTQGSMSKRIDVSTTLAEPRFLIIKHTEDTTRGLTVDRHLVSLDELHGNQAGVPVRLTTNLSFAVPRDTVITRRMVADQIARIFQLLTFDEQLSEVQVSDLDSDGSCLAALLRGEY